MDMNWIDEIRDPEPRKRYIYNADDYDPQYGYPVTVLILFAT